MISLLNVKHALEADPGGATSIAIQDKGKGGFEPLMPTWDMVTRTKAYQGVEKFQYIPLQKRMSPEQYIEAYRKLCIAHKREIYAWIKAMMEKPEERRTFYCYCRPMPANFDVHAELTNETCKRWFCHRLLVYRLLQSWAPQLATIVL